MEQLFEDTGKILAKLICDGASPGYVGAVGTLLLEHALVVGGYNREIAHQVLQAVRDHIATSIEDDALTITPETVAREMANLAPADDDEEEATNQWQN